MTLREVWYTSFQYTVCNLLDFFQFFLKLIANTAHDLFLSVSRDSGLSDQPSRIRNSACLVKYENVFGTCPEAQYSLLVLTEVQAVAPKYEYVLIHFVLDVVQPSYDIDQVLNPKMQALQIVLRHL